MFPRHAHRSHSASQPIPLPPKQQQQQQHQQQQQPPNIHIPSPLDHHQQQQHQHQQHHHHSDLSSEQLPPPTSVPSDSKFLQSISISRIRNRLSISTNRSIRGIIDESSTSVAASPQSFTHLSSTLPPNERASLISPSYQHQHPPPYSSRSTSLQQSCPPPPPLTSPSNNRKSSKALHGIVKRSFKAQAINEIDVQAGESVLVNAYVRQDWLVCKPLSRLGPSGLVPIRHVQVSNAITGEILSTQDLRDLVTSGDLPDLNGWLQSTNAYKSASIPLGTFDLNPAPNSPMAFGQSCQDLHHRNLNHSPVSNDLIPTPDTTTALPIDPSPSILLDSFKPSLQHFDPSSDFVREWQRRQTEQDLDLDLDLIMPPRSSSLSNSATEQLRNRYGTFTDATIESSHEENGSACFAIKIRFLLSDKHRNFLIYRRYQDFLDFDEPFRSRLNNISEPYPENLEFPNLQDPRLGDSIDPDQASHQFRYAKRYLSELSKTPSNIRELKEVYELLAPRHDDLDLEGSSKLKRILGVEVLEYLGQICPSPAPPDQIEFDPSRAVPERRSSLSDQSYLSVTSLRSSHHLSSNLDFEISSLDPISSNSSPVQQFYPSSPRKTPTSPIKSFYSNDGEFTRIKVYDLQSGDVIALKVSNNVGIDELSDKLAIRFSEPSSSLALTDEPNDPGSPKRQIIPKYQIFESAVQDQMSLSEDRERPIDENLVIILPSGPGRLATIKSDDELRDWINSRDRFVLYV